MYCENCGKQIEDGSVFCVNCGHRIDNEELTPSLDNEISVKKNKLPVIICLSVVSIIALLAIIIIVVNVSNRDSLITEDKSNVELKTATENSESEEAEPIKITSEISELKTEVNHQIELAYEITGGQAGEETKVTFSSGDENIAKVDENGMVSGVSAGKTYIEAICGDQEYYWNIEIIPEAIITTNQQDISCYAGQVIQLVSSVSGGDSTYEITYSSDNESIASVNSEGLVTVKGEGEVRIKESFGQYCTLDFQIHSSVLDLSNNAANNDALRMIFDEQADDDYDEEYSYFSSNGEEIIHCNILGWGTYTYKKRSEYVTFWGIRPGDTQEYAIECLFNSGFVKGDTFSELSQNYFPVEYIYGFIPNESDGIYVNFQIDNGVIISIEVGTTHFYSG